MITTIEISQAEQRIKTDEINEMLCVELWGDDNMYITDGKQNHEFEFEITKENAIRLANIIKLFYEI